MNQNLKETELNLLNLSAFHVNPHFLLQVIYWQQKNRSLLRRKKFAKSAIAEPRSIFQSSWTIARNYRYQGSTYWSYRSHISFYRR